MGFPVGYSEVIFQKIFLHMLFVLGLVRSLITVLFSYLGIHDFLELNIAWPDPNIRMPEFQSLSTMLIREILPVAKFSDLVDPPESYSVCLYEFQKYGEIRCLMNCPLCRTPFIPHDMQGAFNERLWAAFGIPEFYANFSEDYTFFNGL